MMIALCSFTVYFHKGYSNNSNKSLVNKRKNSTITLTVDELHPGIKIPDDFLGLSYEVTALTDTVFFKSNHVRFKNLMTGLGDGIVRLNGYYVSFVPWSGHKRTALMDKGRDNYLTDSITMTDLDSLFTFIRPTNWKVILGIQFPNSYPDRTYSEIHYAWLKGKDVIKAFEIGNESESLFKGNFSVYYNQLLPNIQVIKDRLPEAPLCGPATVHPDLTVGPFLKVAYDKVNFITYHTYPVGEDHVANNLSQLLDNKNIVAVAHTSHMVDSLCKEKNIRYRIDECNNYGDGGVGVSERFASALWGLDFMFTVAQNNSLGINFHGGGWGFTPIKIKKGEPIVPQPLYYGMLFFHLASQGQILPVKLENASKYVKAYAVLGKSKKILVTLINKDPNNDASVQLRCKNKFSNGSFIRLTSPSVSSIDQVTLGGSSVDANGNWHAASETSIASQDGVFDIALPKGSATLVTINN